MTTEKTDPPGATEHPAIWLMRRIGRLIKWTVLIVVALAVVGGAGIWAYNYWTDTLPSSQVQVTVNSTQDICSDARFPLFVGIVNNSSRTVEEVTFSLVAKRPGYSTDLVDYSNRSYSTDKIMKPGKGFAQCWSLPTLSDKAVDWRRLEWSIGYYYVHFE